MPNRRAIQLQRKSNWKPFAVISVIFLVALAVLGAGGGAAAGKGKTLKYVGSAPGVKMVFEGPASGKGYPKSIKIKVTGTSQCALDGGVKKPLPFTFEHTEKVYPVTSRHGEWPGFEINSETELLSAVSEWGVNPEFAPADTEIFIRGAFVKHGKEVSVNFTHDIPVNGSEIGTTEPEVFCKLHARLSLKQVK